MIKRTIIEIPDVAAAQSAAAAAASATAAANSALLAEAGQQSGTTAERPVPEYVGQPYFDTTLGYPIWCSQLDPALWVNATGIEV